MGSVRVFKVSQEEKNMVYEALMSVKQFLSTVDRISDVIGELRFIDMRQQLGSWGDPDQHSLVDDVADSKQGREYRESQLVELQGKLETLYKENMVTDIPLVHAFLTQYIGGYGIEGIITRRDVEFVLSIANNPKPYIEGGHRGVTPLMDRIIKCVEGSKVLYTLRPKTDGDDNTHLEVVKTSEKSEE